MEENETKKPAEWGTHQLQPSSSPVVPGLETHELLFGANQPEYQPLRALKSRMPNGAVLTRWAFTDEQRAAIAAGADLYLSIWTFHQALMPIAMIVSEVPPDPEIIKGDFGYNPPAPPKEQPPVAVHVAGEIEGDQQKCARCGIVLIDATGAMALDGSGPMRSWRVGTIVAKNDSGSWITNHPLEPNYYLCTPPEMVN